MRHLSLADNPSEKSYISERVEQEGKVADGFHSAFGALLDSRKSAGLRLRTHDTSDALAEHPLVKPLSELGDNEACYIEHRDGFDDELEKHVLAIKRTQGNEAIFTFISMSQDDSGVQSARLTQEITDSELGFSRQIDVMFDTNVFDVVTVSSSSRINDVYHRDTDKDRHNIDHVLDIINNIVENAIPASVDEVVVHSITQETDRIKENLRGKGRIRALGATIKHIPELYRHEREVAA